MSNFRSLHEDFINGEIKVTWVNGTHDPANTPRQLRPMTQTNYIKELAARDNVKII